MAQGWPLSRRGRVSSLPRPGTWGTLSLPADPASLRSQALQAEFSPQPKCESLGGSP